jgi:CheY-like chemotaxis protein
VGKILIVEDDAGNLEIITRLLKLKCKGYQLLTAGDGAQAVVLARAELPDLIVMDIGLPVLDGWEATRQIKADDATRAIPVIALTARAMATDKEKAREVGCDEFESKPYDFARLLGKVKALLPKDNPA